MSQAPDLQWQQPARQARVAMLFIALKYLRRALRQAWPLFLVVVVRGGEGSTLTRVLYLALVITGLQLITSIVSWFRFSFFVKNDELIVEQGLFRRKRSSIPLPRIQSLQFDQNVLQRRLGVVEVQVETAGSQGAELSIDALERDRAEALRHFIMARKADLQPEATPRLDPETGESVAPAPEAAQAAETLLTLSRRSLLYAGLSSNHLRTAGLIVGSLLGLYQLAGDVLPLADPNQLIEQAIGVAPQALWQSTLILMIALALGAVMVSLVQTWLRHYDLQLSADNEGFRLVAGLLNRREQLMRHDKLQYLRSSSNPLQDWLGLRSLQLLQVGGSRAGRQAMTIPGCDEAAWEQVRHRMFAPEAEAGMSWGTIHPRVIRRYLIQLGFVPVLIATLALWSQVGAWILLAWLWLGPAYWLARRYQRTFRYGLNGEMLRVRSALLLRREAQLWLYKVQVVHITQSFVQRRAGLASLTLAMATGSVEIPYLPLATAQALRDLLLYQVERAQQDWM